MEKHDNLPSSAASVMAPSFSELDYSAAVPPGVGGGMVDYMLNQGPLHDHFGSGPSSQMMAFGDVLHFADFGPKLALHPYSNEPGDSSRAHPRAHEPLEDPVSMLRFPVLNENRHHHESHEGGSRGGADRAVIMRTTSGAGEFFHDQSNEPAAQLEFLGAASDPALNCKNSGKRKRARIVKTNEEVESQRRTHIAVERNRRKQMNEHLRVLRSLMPTSYVQRGDQASIVGGAIEFVRELEQLLQCLESQKRRRLYGEPSPLPLPSNADQLINDVDNPSQNLDGVGLQEETAAESKSAIADIEVKLQGLDAFIKILSRRRPGQLINAISALQDLHFTILHTNVTTIEQTVLYSFNVKISSETSFSADDIANYVQQIFTFIHANTAM